MEAHTMGKFIAALRKANGMTQKELAEKLNVSDKSVSRWERDEGAPDLSLIPVIAEVFGITCDELLRGERRPEAQRREAPEAEAMTPRADRQRRRLLLAAATRLRSRTLLAAGIACLGFIAAMICNLVFLRAYLGFFAALILYLAAGICEAVFLNSSSLALSDLEEDEDVQRLRQDARRLGLALAVLVLGLLVCTLPLFTLPTDTYMGLTAGTWLAAALRYALFAMPLVFIALYLAEGYRLKTAEAPSPRAMGNWRLKGCIAFLCAILLAVTTAVCTTLWDTARLAEGYGETFDSFEAFKGFMETEALSTSSGTAVSAVEHAWFDDSIPVAAPAETDYPQDEIRIDNGTPQGQLVGTFHWKNQTVCSYSVDANDPDNLLFTITTDAHWQQARQAQQVGYGICAVLCLLEVAGAILLYQRLKKG